MGDTIRGCAVLKRMDLDALEYSDKIRVMCCESLLMGDQINSPW